MSSHYRKSLAGFTLIELSIVLIIIGLIVSGVLTGKELIKSAELRRFMDDMSNYELATNTFKLKYDALPADMPNASAIWGAKCDVKVTGLAPCNGNGDGVISSSDVEYVKFWYHLSLAGLIAGNYNPPFELNYGGGSEPDPAEMIEWGSVMFPKGPGGGGYFMVTDGILLYGNISANGVAGSLSGTEAFSVDNKIDDGMLATGNFRADAFESMSTGGNTCGTAEDNYDRSSTKKGCIIMRKSSTFGPIPKKGVGHVMFNNAGQASSDPDPEP